MSFSRQTHAENTEFLYQWPGQPEIKFVLENKVANEFRENKRYSADLAHLHVRNELVRAAARLQKPGLRIRLSPANLPLDYEISAPDAATAASIAAELQQVQQQAYNRYLNKGAYYLLTTTNNEKYIIPDHVWYFQQSLPDLQIVAKAFTDQYGNQNIRQLAVKVANWIQQIPYRNLSDRRESAGVGYAAPLQVIFDHSGDCDSKAVLFAAVMRVIFPRSSFHIVYLPNHAIIAAQIPPVAQEKTIRIDGVNLLLIDATGPATLNLGEISPEYQVYINNGQFNHRSL